ncbi:MAG: hypothetical protein ABIO67_05415 [Mycobacteriales bacterium]
MIGTLASGVDGDAVRAELASWEQRNRPPGFQSSHVLVSDDGRTIVNVAIFDSKESYQALAGDPDQSQWWEQHFAPLLEGEPRWIDGPWVS